jgi:hypothetical protein
MVELNRVHAPGVIHLMGQLSNPSQELERLIAILDREA